MNIELIFKKTLPEKQVFVLLEHEAEYLDDSVAGPQQATVYGKKSVEA